MKNVETGGLTAAPLGFGFVIRDSSFGFDSGIRHSEFEISVYRTFTLGTTDIPGPRRNPSVLSNVIFTGTRWTTFT